MYRHFPNKYKPSPDSTNMPRKTLIGHMESYINDADFLAVQDFEIKHPELYKNAKTACAKMPVMQQMTVQANAFNGIFDSPQYGAEFKQTIERFRNTK